MSHIDVDPDRLARLVESLLAAIRRIEITAFPEPQFVAALESLSEVLPDAEAAVQIAGVQDLLDQYAALRRELLSKANALADSVFAAGRIDEPADPNRALRESIARQASGLGAALTQKGQHANVGIYVYLDTDDEESAGYVFEKIDQLAYLVGADDVVTIDFRRGSFFRRSVARFDSHSPGPAL